MSSTHRSRLIAFTAAVSVITGLVTGAAGAASAHGISSSSSIANLNAAPGEARGEAPLTLLKRLRVAPERPAGYDRSLYQHWADMDGDGCDTRRELIISESLSPVNVGADCWIDRGHWVSVYDAVSTTGYPSKFDADHLVALNEAHQSGAYAWTPERRKAFANDLDHPESLILVTASTNRSKSDKDPAQWLPPRTEARCGYVSDWVRVKATWDLTIDPAEKRAIERVLRACPATATLVN